LKELELPIEIRPQCIHGREPSLTAEGYFLPCCWADRRNTYFQKAGFFNPELNISNVDDIVTEVFNSETWISFFNMLEYNSKEAPNVCKEYCGVNKDTNKKVYY